MTDHTFPDRTDLCILDALQDDIPLVPLPYAAIAGRLGIREDFLLERLRKLEHDGILRGIAPTFESGLMGLTAATLVAFHVPGERAAEVADIISSYPEVSHNFRREHYYSIWFTVSGKDEEDIRLVLDGILHRTGIPETDMLNLPTVRKLKVDVRFSLSDKNERGDSSGPG